MDKKINTYMHLKLGEGRATMAVSVKNDVANVAVSFCSPTDQFSRKKGRELADSRLEEANLLYVLDLKKGESVQTTIRHALYKSVLNRQHAMLPGWAFKKHSVEA